MEMMMVGGGARESESYKGGVQERAAFFLTGKSTTNQERQM